MSRIALSAAKWRAGLQMALGRFPYAIACGALGSGCAILAIHRSGDDAVVGQCERLAMTLALGLPLFFSLRILRERWYREPHWNAANAIMDGLDLAVAPGDQWVTYRRVSGAIDVTGLRKVWPVLSLYSGGEAKWSPQKFGELQIGFDHNVLKMALGNSAPEPIPLDELLKDLPAAPNAELSDEQSRVDFTQQNRTFRVVLTSLQLRPRTSGPVPLTIECVLLER